MAERPWKKAEREVARRLGGRRIPVTGRARGSAPDVDAAWIAAEVKSRRELPLWLVDAAAQARAGAGMSQLGVVVLHQDGDRFDRALVVLTLGDWMDWFGGSAAKAE